MAAALIEAETQWVRGDRMRRIIVELQQRQLERQFEEARNAAEPSDEAGDEASWPDEASDEEPPAPKDDTSAVGEAEGDDAEDDAEEDDDQDDRPFPQPPPSLSPRREAQLRQFDDAAKVLSVLTAKPAHEFLAAAISAFDLETVVDFLQQVLREKRKTASANQDRVGDVMPMKTE